MVTAPPDPGRTDDRQRKMNSMVHDSFEQQCDRLSAAVDAAQFERLRWARTEAPMLARLVELALGAVADRQDFELTEEGSVAAVKRFVLKVHGFRIAALNLGLDQGHAVVWAEAIDRSKYIIAGSDPVSADFRQVDQAWMAAALEAQFARVQG